MSACASGWAWTRVRSQVRPPHRLRRPTQSLGWSATGTASSRATPKAGSRDSSWARRAALTSTGSAGVDATPARTRKAPPARVALCTPAVDASPASALVFAAQSAMPAGACRHATRMGCPTVMVGTAAKCKGDWRMCTRSPCLNSSYGLSDRSKALSKEAPTVVAPSTAARTGPLAAAGSVSTTTDGRSCWPARGSPTEAPAHTTSAGPTSSDSRTSLSEAATPPPRWR